MFPLTFKFTFREGRSGWIVRRAAATLYLLAQRLGR